MPLTIWTCGGEKSWGCGIRRARLQETSAGRRASDVIAGHLRDLGVLGESGVSSGDAREKIRGAESASRSCDSWVRNAVIRATADTLGAQASRLLFVPKGRRLV